MALKLAVMEMKNGEKGYHLIAVVRKNVQKEHLRKAVKGTETRDQRREGMLLMDWVDEKRWKVSIQEEERQKKWV